MVQSLDYSTLKSSAIQVAASLLANMAMLNCGMVLAFPSAMVPPLTGSGPGLHATVEEASWVAGTMFISSPVACLVAGPFIDWLGRHRGLLVTNLTFASGWLLLAVFPSSLVVIYVGRLLTGFGLGIASCATVSYTAEIATVQLRTTLAILAPTMMSIGNFLSYLLAMIFQETWTEAAYFCLSLTIFTILMMPLLPESPLWLLNYGRKEEALEALRKLRGASTVEQVAQEMESFTGRTKDKAAASSWWSVLRRPQAYKPLFIMNMFFLFQQTSGMAIVISYAVDFTRAAGIEAQAYYIALAIGITRMISTFLTTWVCSQYGRRVVALVSSFVTGASVLALAVCLLLHSSPVICGTFMMFYVLASAMGFSTLPWSMIGEIFPTDARGIASGLTSCFTYIEAFVAVKIYPGLVLSLGSVPILIFFGAASLVGTVFLYLFLPETHGKTLAEIEEYFKGTKKHESGGDVS